MRRRSTLPCRMHGFTLLELLVALAAAILLIAALSEIIISIKDGWSRATRIEQQWSDEALTQQLISRVLEAAIPPDHSTTQGVRFKGLENAIEFSTVPSQSAFALGHMDGRLFLTPRANGLFNLELHLDSPSTMSTLTETPIGQNWTLLNEIKTIEFFYFARGSRQASNRWVEMDTLPELIKLHVIFADETRLPFWVTAHPHQTISGNCLLDRTSFMCRAS